MASVHSNLKMSEEKAMAGKKIIIWSYLQLSVTSPFVKVIQFTLTIKMFELAKILPFLHS